MLTPDALSLPIGSRVLVKRDRTLVRDAKPATLISRPSPSHAAPTYGFLWVRFDGSNLPELRECTIHAREIRSVIL